MKVHFSMSSMVKHLSREIGMRGQRVIMLACCGVAVAAFSTSPNDSVRYQGAVVGTVFDSLTMRPLAGALVQMLLPGQPAVSTPSASRRMTSFLMAAPESPPAYVLARNPMFLNQ